MGLAVIVPDISFAGANIGQVTPVSPTPTPLVSLAVTGPDSIVTPTLAGQYSVAYTPANTTERGVTWSLTSGGTLASIDSNGYLTITGNGSVTIRATSAIDQTIYAEKVVAVQAIAITPLEDLTARFYFGNNAGYFVTDITLVSGDYLKTRIGRTASTSTVAFACGSRQLSNADTDTTSIETDGPGKIHAKLFGTKWSSENSWVKGTSYTIVAKESGVTCSPSLGTFTSTTYTYTQGYPLCINGILYANNTVGYNSYLQDFYGLEVYGSDDTLKHRLIPQADLTLLDEVTNQTYTKTGGGDITYTEG